MAISKVIVVGAGPSGLLLAILLAKAGIHVDLLEMTHELDKNPRASHYADSSCHEFERAGILDELRSKGFFPNGVSWRKLDEAKTRLVALRGPPGAAGQEDRYRMVCLPLDKLGIILEATLAKEPTAVVRYDHKVVALEQDKDAVRVIADTPQGQNAFTADYVVGCDGGNSTIRKLLFGAGVFPGFTWDKQIVATNMYYDFSPYDYDDSQFFVHPDHWHMVAKIQADGLHRVTYGEIGGLTNEEMKARMPQKFKDILPGHPDPDKYTVVNFSPYRVHQRCVDHMRVGRVLLAADAAHLCNPFGGMGLTGGIADIGGLYDCLVGIHTGAADDSILDEYDEVRRKIWREIINPVSSENMRRLFEDDPDQIMETDPFLKVLKQMELGQLQPQPQGGATMGLRYDMTQHYSTETREHSNGI